MTRAQQAAQSIRNGSTLKDETIAALNATIGICRPAHYSTQADLFAHAVTAILGGSHAATDALLEAYFQPQHVEAYMPEEPEATAEEYLDA